MRESFGLAPALRESWSSRSGQTAGRCRGASANFDSGQLVESIGLAFRLATVYHCSQPCHAVFQNSCLIAEATLERQGKWQMETTEVDFRLISPDFLAPSCHTSFGGLLEHVWNALPQVPGPQAVTEKNITQSCFNVSF